MSERLEDKFIVFSDDSKAGYFRILYPYSCFEEGRGNIRLKAVKLVSIHDENGFLKSSFPMLPILREKTVETRFLKNNELFGTVLENAEMTVYIQTKEKGSAIITIDKTYKKIIDAIYRRSNDCFCTQRSFKFSRKQIICEMESLQFQTLAKSKTSALSYCNATNRIFSLFLYPWSGYSGIKKYRDDLC